MKEACIESDTRQLFCQWHHVFVVSPSQIFPKQLHMAVSASGRWRPNDLARVQVANQPWIGLCRGACGGAKSAWNCCVFMKFMGLIGASPVRIVVKNLGSMSENNIAMMDKCVVAKGSVGFGLDHFLWMYFGLRMFGGLRFLHGVYTWKKSEPDFPQAMESVLDQDFDIFIVGFANLTWHGRQAAGWLECSWLENNPYSSPSLRQTMPKVNRWKTICASFTVSSMSN